MITIVITHISIKVNGKLSYNTISIPYNYSVIVYLHTHHLDWHSWFWTGTNWSGWVEILDAKKLILLFCQLHFKNECQTYVSTDVCVLQNIIL